ncbi:MAG: bifunctional DNA-formamidopyrimidine glycosylase/DNA-(apurinic or apyrimidinic site) lyase [Chloroflexota bacterium]
MPELPEVETIKNEIAPAVVGQCLKKVTVFDTKPIKDPSPADFVVQTVGRTITGLRRRGKYLIFDLSTPSASSPEKAGRQDISLIIHLKMSGALLVNPPEDRKYRKVLFQLDNGTRLMFVDPRRFGSMWLVKDPETILSKLGPEPFSGGFTAGELARRLKGRNAPLKAVLLDQTMLAGVGNMYADEALFTARIHPERRASDLTSGEVKLLYGAIKKVLSRAIERKGASTRDYVRPDGQPGGAHLEFSVAHRGGEPCPICGGPVARIVVRNRGTYYCPNCQRK